MIEVKFRAQKDLIAFLKLVAVARVDESPYIQSEP